MAKGPQGEEHTWSSFMQSAAWHADAVTQVLAARGFWVAACHLVWGLWLLFNICYHYYHAVHDSPGCTKDLDLQVCVCAVRQGASPAIRKFVDLCCNILHMDESDQ